MSFWQPNIQSTGGA